jgi:hypothetical protein
MTGFTPEDLDVVTGCVVDAWCSGLDRDWSVPAGTVEWSCTVTATHAVDAVLAVALFLASRRRDGYPEWICAPAMPEDGGPEHLVEAMGAVGRVLTGVVATAPPGTEAVIWRRPRVEVRPAADFAARGALEMVLHGHDVAAGLGATLAPPAAVCARLRDHTRGWPHWSSPGWRPAPATDDPWSDLLVGSGRA